MKKPDCQEVVFKIMHLPDFNYTTELELAQDNPEYLTWLETQQNKLIQQKEKDAKKKIANAQFIQSIAAANNKPAEIPLEERLNIFFAQFPFSYTLTPNKKDFILTISPNAPNIAKELKSFGLVIEGIKGVKQLKFQDPNRQFTINENQLNVLIDNGGPKRSLLTDLKIKPAATSSATNNNSNSSNTNKSTQADRVSTNDSLAEENNSNLPKANKKQNNDELAQSELENWQDYLNKLWCLPYGKDFFSVALEMGTKSLIIEFPNEADLLASKNLNQAQIKLIQEFIQKEFFPRISRNLEDKNNNNNAIVYAKVSLNQAAMQITVKPSISLHFTVGNNLRKEIADQFTKLEENLKKLKTQNESQNNLQVNSSDNIQNKQIDKNQAAENAQGKEVPANKKSKDHNEKKEVNDPGQNKSQSDKKKNLNKKNNQQEAKSEDKQLPQDPIVKIELQSLFLDISFPINKDHSKQPALNFASCTKLKETKWRLIYNSSGVSHIGHNNTFMTAASFFQLMITSINNINQLRPNTIPANFISYHIKGNEIEIIINTTNSEMTLKDLIQLLRSAVYMQHLQQDFKATAEVQHLYVSLPNAPTQALSKEASEPTPNYQTQTNLALFKPVRAREITQSDIDNLNHHVRVLEDIQAQLNKKPKKKKKKKKNNNNQLAAQINNNNSNNDQQVAIQEIERIQSEIKFHCYLLHALRIVIILSDIPLFANNSDTKTLLRHWRNFIRHGFDQLDQNFYALMQQFLTSIKGIIGILPLISNAVKIEIKDKRLQDAINNLRQQIAPYLPELENRSLNTNQELNNQKYQTLLNDLQSAYLSLSDTDRSQARDAILFVCMILGKLNKKDKESMHYQSYIQIGHKGFEQGFNEFRDFVFFTYLSSNLFPNLNVSSEFYSESNGLKK